MSAHGKAVALSVLRITLRRNADSLRVLSPSLFWTVAGANSNPPEYPLVTRKTTLEIHQARLPALPACVVCAVCVVARQYPNRLVLGTPIERG